MAKSKVVAAEKPVENVKISNVAETLTPMELHQIREAQRKSVLATALAEKGLAQAQTAELEHKNIILSVCNKYHLDVSKGDTITEDGTIRRANQDVASE